jgi:S-adenosylmethionine-diacylglycerol 3-amino-3-carboxypropyl transferase
VSRVDTKADFSRIRYANCWEDAGILLTALAPRLAGGRALSIASAGDNTLAMLLLAPERVVAVDFSVAQLACLDLRMAGFRRLSYEELLGFLGVEPSDSRGRVYRALRGELSSDSRAFWDAHDRLIERGVIHAGKFERYFGFLRAVVKLVQSRRRVDQLLVTRAPSERADFYASQWNTWLWRSVTGLVCSRRVMGALGRDPSFFAHAEGSMAAHVRERAAHAATAQDPAANPYLRYILTGEFAGCLPLYLEREHFEDIRSRLDCVELLRGDVSDAASRHGPFDAFNLSDVFEYMSRAEFDACAERLAGAATADACVAYWNMLAPRDLAESRPADFVAERERAGCLHRRDRAFFYSAFHVARRRS